MTVIDDGLSVGFGGSSKSKPDPLKRPNELPEAVKKMLEEKRSRVAALKTLVDTEEKALKVYEALMGVENERDAQEVDIVERFRLVRGMLDKQPIRARNLKHGYDR